MSLHHKPRVGKVGRDQTLDDGEMRRETALRGRRNPYVREFQWRKWFAGPYVPLIVDTGAAREQGVLEARLEAEAAESREPRASYFIDLLEIDDELRERPPKCGCVV